MPAYVIANIEVDDLERYMAEYGPPAGANVALHGGRFLTRGGQSEVLEGDGLAGRIVIIEFDSYEAASAWYHSDDYAPLREIRLRYARSELAIVDGVPPSD